MPLINRIRVNNVLYNFGTQQYDDFVMRMNGRSTIYDLANGGGKSVLLLLLLQNMIPNCTLDEKQPVEKLFRTSGGSSVIHSLIEWKLDECFTEEDRRYMLTGFCARAASTGQTGADSPEDEDEGAGDTQSIEYYNYCIFYRGYNDNDIVNLPLVRDGRHVSFNELKNYLKQLQHDDRELRVCIFERKGEYQDFISHYGIYESAWEIIRGINKTEGHVRTYFETNYRTARKVVEDLLIQEIIERSFHRDSGDETYSVMARTLLDIKDKLLELSEKRRKMNHFDYEKELLKVLAGRVGSMKKAYSEEHALAGELLAARKLLQTRVEQAGDDLEQKRRAAEEKKTEYSGRQNVIACLKVQQLEDDYLKSREVCQDEKKKLKDLEAVLAEHKTRLNRISDAEDFLALKKAEAEREEMKAALRLSSDRTGDVIDRLADLVAVKKRFMEEKKFVYTDQSESLSREESELKQSVKGMLTGVKQLECERAVCESRAADLRSELDSAKDQLAQAKQEAGLLVAEDAPVRAKECADQMDELAARKLEREKELKAASEEYDAVREKLIACEAQARERENISRGQKKLLDRKKQGDARLDVLFKSFRMDKTSEDAVPADLNELASKLAEREKEISSSLSEVLKEKKTADAASLRLDQGLVLPGGTMERVADVLADRYEIDAVTGEEYLAQLDPEKREETLNRIPVMAGCIITDQWDDIVPDTALRDIMGDHVLIVISTETALSGDMNEPAGIRMISPDAAPLLDPEAFRQRKQYLEKKRSSLDERARGLSDSLQSVREDEAFLQGQSALMGVLTLSEDETPEEDYDSLKSRAADIQKHMDEMSSEIAELNESIEKQKVYAESFGNVKDLFNKAESLRKSLGEREAELKDITARTGEGNRRLADKNSRLKEIRQELSSVNSALELMRQQWDEKYSKYDQDRKPLDQGLDETQLDAEIQALMAVADQRTGSDEDKRILLDHAEENIKRVTAALKRRGADLEMLNSAWSQGRLKAVPDSDTEEESGEVKRYEEEVERAGERHHRAEAELNRMAGSLDHGRRDLEERGIKYTRLSIEPEDLKRSMDEQKQLSVRMKEDMDRLAQECREQQKKLASMEDFMKDIGRLADYHHLTWPDDEPLPDLADYSPADLKKCRSAFEKAAARTEALGKDVLDYREQTARALSEMEAFELADAIRRDVTVPRNLEDIDSLLSALSEMSRCIDLEKDRVSQSTADIALIKRNFESQCIRQCLEVKSRLDRLDSLSEIELDGQRRRMLVLHIPYVPEEQLPERMSAYIDDVVRRADEIADPGECLKFIRSRLALKRLFSVMVTDMSRIKLSLYKRERIPSQSRYLPWEEAVGSTGQSQGIYIQFLIAVINYIASINSGTDAGECDKVIFIDNPFGAARDLYIWEPIFEMLKTNNCQLIVPARGVTPAITARFDVNYVLGQKLVNGRQQTVVVDYRSQVDSPEMEYRRVEYTQNSFDFI